MKKNDSTTDDFDSINKDVFFGKCDFIENWIDFFTSLPLLSPQTSDYSEEAK